MAGALSQKLIESRSSFLAILKPLNFLAATRCFSANFSKGLGGSLLCFLLSLNFLHRRARYW